jgi:hypothetical protein
MLTKFRVQGQFVGTREWSIEQVFANVLSIDLLPVPLTGRRYVPRHSKGGAMGNPALSPFRTSVNAKDSGDAL